MELESLKLACLGSRAHNFGYLATVIEMELGRYLLFRPSRNEEPYSYYEGNQCKQEGNKCIHIQKSRECKEYQGYDDHDHSNNQAIRPFVHD